MHLQQEIYFLPRDLQNFGDILDSFSMAMHAQNLGPRRQVEPRPYAPSRYGHCRLNLPVTRFRRQLRNLCFRSLQRKLYSAVDIADAAAHIGSKGPGINQRKKAHGNSCQSQYAEDAQRYRHTR